MKFTLEDIINCVVDRMPYNYSSQNKPVKTHASSYIYDDRDFTRLYRNEEISHQHECYGNENVNCPCTCQTNRSFTRPKKKVRHRYAFCKNALKRIDPSIICTTWI